MTVGEQLNPPRILIVDDEPTNIQALAHLLKTDYHIQVATNGEKALRIACDATPPDLILLDVEMPELGGHEVCQKLKDNPETRNIPIIFVTGRASTEDEEIGLSLGAVDYISKPFTPSITRARVRNHIDLKLKTDKLEQLSRLDGLTELPNRRLFDERLSEEWGRAKRNREELSLVMLDVDEFKNFNDNYGHSEGDACLRRVACVLSSTISRSADMVARYGGEEFVALLPATDSPGAGCLAEAFRAAVEGLSLRHEFSSSSAVVTLSLGTATYTPDESIDSPDELLRMADKALYEAKSAGRNRVKSYN